MSYEHLSSRGIDWKTIRYAQKELKIRKRLSPEEFKTAWINYFGEPKTEQERIFLNSGIWDFYEDYMTSNFKDVKEYFRYIEE